MPKKRNVTITNLSERQADWLERTAKEKGLTITTVVKFLIEQEIKREATL